MTELLGVEGLDVEVNGLEVTAEIDVGVDACAGVDVWAGGVTAPGISGKILFFQIGNFLPGKVSFCSVLSASILAI